MHRLSEHASKKINGSLKILQSPLRANWLLESRPLTCPELRIFASGDVEKWRLPSASSRLVQRSYLEVSAEATQARRE